MPASLSKNRRCLGRKCPKRRQPTPGTLLAQRPARQSFKARLSNPNWSAGDPGAVLRTVERVKDLVFGIHGLR